MSEASERLRVLRAKRRAAGQCVRCCDPVNHGGWYCSACSDAANAARRIERVEQSVTYDGVTQTLEEWANELGCTPNAIRMRMLKHGNPHGIRADGSLAAQSGGFRSVEKDGSWQADYKARQLVAERGPLTLQEIADHMGVTRERVRQIETVALRKLRNTAPHIEANLRELDRLRAESDARVLRKEHVAARRAS